ncbi:MAG: hypothetical protein KGZ69_05400 [Methylomonas sp.]|nr:hypothetical protein [Methylomonas sp.]
MTISIDRTQWPKSSQKFGAANYDDRALHYENLAYRCRKCEASFVFTAEAQKSAYEIQKKNTSWFPKLCATCQEDLEKFRAEDCEYQLRWNRNQDDLKVNQEFLQRWLFVTARN